MHSRQWTYPTNGASVSSFVPYIVPFSRKAYMDYIWAKYCRTRQRSSKLKNDAKIGIPADSLNASAINTFKLVSPTAKFSSRRVDAENSLSLSLSLSLSCRHAVKPDPDRGSGQVSARLRHRRARRRCRRGLLGCAID